MPERGETQRLFICLQVCEIIDIVSVKFTDNFSLYLPFSTQFDHGDKNYLSLCNSQGPYLNSCAGGDTLRSSMWIVASALAPRGFVQLWGGSREWIKRMRSALDGLTCTFHFNEAICTKSWRLCRWWAHKSPSAAGWAGPKMRPSTSSSCWGQPQYTSRLGAGRWGEGSC